MNATGLRAGIYVRISRDDEGEGLGVARQEDACRQLAERLGWVVVDVYPDNSKGAHDRRKKREQYERMLSDVEAGRINAVLCYALDRLTRHPMELERLVEIFVAGRTAVQTVAGGDLDLNTEEGQLRARITGSVARFESGRKSERLKAKAAQMIAQGKRPCGGPRPFGYDRVYDAPQSARRRIVAEVVNEREAEAIRDAAGRLLRGESMRSIITGWNDRGLLTSLGNRWSITSFRQMMTSGRLAGLVVHKRQIVDGVTAAWPAILDRGTHEELKALFSGRGTPRGSNALKFWLTGHIFCTCGGPMRVSPGKSGKRRYVCAPKTEGGCGGRVIDLARVDKQMTRLVIKRLSTPGILRDLAARQNTDSDKAAKLVGKIEGDERRLAALKAQLSECEPEELLELRGAIRKVRGRIAAGRDKLAPLVGAQSLVGVDIDDLAERWEDLDPSLRGGLLRVAGVERIVIHPAHARALYEPERVEIVPV
jgi:site-specific DNA recombinase